MTKGRPEGIIKATPSGGVTTIASRLYLIPEGFSGKFSTPSALWAWEPFFVVVEKPFAKHIPWVGWTYSTTWKRKVRGLHIVVLLWRAGPWRIPVAFRLWRPRANCAPRQYRAKGQLAWEMLVEVVAYLPKYGALRLVVTRNRHGNYEVLATNDLDGDLSTVVLRKRSRWFVETLFRDAKQFSGLGACQCRVDQAMVRYVAFSLIAFVALQRLRLHPKETLGEVKNRLQKEALLGCSHRPAPLKGKVALSQFLTA